MVREEIIMEGNRDVTLLQTWGLGKFPWAGEMWLDTWNIRRNQICELGGTASLAEAIRWQRLVVEGGCINWAYTCICWPERSSSLSLSVLKLRRKGWQAEYRWRWMPCGRSGKSKEVWEEHKPRCFVNVIVEAQRYYYNTASVFSTEDEV